MSITHTSNPEKLQKHSEFQYHIRMYRDEDRQQVHELYENALFWESHSPLRPFLKAVAKESPISRALYLTSAVGVLLWPSYPRLGPTIFLTAAAIGLLQAGLIFQFILKATRKNLHGDLADIRKHYELVPSAEASSYDHGNLISSGPKAFWVVVATQKVTGRTELVGCGGMDIVQDEGKVDAEFQRMAVSGRHLRQGVAAMVVQAAAAHARSHKLSSVQLMTSMVQKPAIQLYKKHGWVEERRQDINIFGMIAQSVHMRLHLTENVLLS
ncbi:acyl-CoA N-acyltransferase [Macrolepiota fuliginosa MF-IS2]|uniref:Acyl-CoA N-acyltransferase n=1 Tax=Macrolepiota fuliginosa MF-IS2 TaxID=1400762 RepID=A0A9P5XMT3_9AGAR|nr:acyl-CoA N-acyltransferase [Macrolepiota fuliginosa MF-IS2]